MKRIIMMWLRVIRSMLTGDLKKVPEDMRDNEVMIANNMIATNTGLKIIFQIMELGTKVPVHLISLIKDEMNKKNLKIKVDYTIKFMPCKPLDDDKYSIKERIRVWEIIANSNPASGEYKEQEIIDSQECLYTINDMKTRGNTIRCFMYVVLEGELLDIQEGVRILKGILEDSGSAYVQIQSDLEKTYKRVAIVSLDCENQKSDPSFYANTEILASILPLPLTAIEDKGVTFGLDAIKRIPYKIDFSTKDIARNIVVLASAGSGKTFTILNLAQSALEAGERVCVTDIKGNEFGKLVRSVGGIVIDLKQTDNKYINPFKLNYKTRDPETEFSINRELALKTFLIISECTPDTEMYSKLSTIISDFLVTYFENLGIIKDNTKTWKLSENLTIQQAYQGLLEYIRIVLSKDDYDSINPYINNINKYINGDYSYVFSKEMSVSEFLDAPAISFAFHILTASDIIPTLYRLKFHYMNLIATKYIMNNYSQGIRTTKINEEAQTASGDIFETYVKDFVLGRSRKQDNIFIANSITSLDGDKAKAIIDNTRVLLISDLKEETLQFLTKQFDLGVYDKMIRNLKQQEDHTFFLYDNLNDGVATYIKAFYPSGIPCEIAVPEGNSDGNNNKDS